MLPSLPIDRDRGTPPGWRSPLPCRSGCATLATRVGSSCYGDWRRIEQLDIATMHRASPSPAEFTVSHPYIFSFYFVPTERRPELACLARLP